jgi:hypothetical protein
MVFFFCFEASMSCAIRQSTGHMEMTTITKACDFHRHDIGQGSK